MRPYDPQDESPQSPYAAELNRGVSTRAFDSLLEQEYRTAHLRRVRWRLRVWLSLNACAAIACTARQFSHDGASSAFTIAHTFLMIPCISALVWLVWTRSYESHYMRTSRILMPLYFGLVAVFAAREIARGETMAVAVQTANMIGLFFYGGLFFSAAVSASLSVLCCFTIAGCLLQLPAAGFIQTLLLLGLTSIVAAMIYYDVEKTYRKSFLESALLAHLVSRDSLSGLMNRRAFDEHLALVWKQGARDQRVIAVLMIDLDHFKRFNDNHGHQAGDAAIRATGRILRTFARRPLDMAARYGGEEFVMILYDLKPDHVRDLAEGLRLSIATAHLRSEGRPRSTASIGVALGTPALERSPDQLLRDADEALYLAKREGRDRVVIKEMETHSFSATGRFAARSTRIA